MTTIAHAGKIDCGDRSVLGEERRDKRPPMRVCAAAVNKEKAVRSGVRANPTSGSELGNRRRRQFEIWASYPWPIRTIAAAWRSHPSPGCPSTNARSGPPLTRPNWRRACVRPQQIDRLVQHQMMPRSREWNDMVAVAEMLRCEGQCFVG